MLRVMYKNAQLHIILATKARGRDLSDFERGVSKEHIGFKGRVCACVRACVHSIDTQPELMGFFKTTIMMQIHILKLYEMTAIVAFSLFIHMVDVYRALYTTGTAASI
jgi:hypothetical protein